MNKKKQLQPKLSVQLKEVNQSILLKEGRVKRYWDSVLQYKENRSFKDKERKFNQQVGGENTMINKQQDAKETKKYWSKICSKKNIIEMPNR